MFPAGTRIFRAAHEHGPAVGFGGKQATLCGTRPDEATGPFGGAVPTTFGSIDGLVRGGSENLRASGLLLPIEIRTDVGTTPAASLAGESRLDIGQPNAIRPPVARDRRPVAATKIGTVDQQAANASGAHLGEGDLLAARLGHGPMIAPTGPEVKPLRLGHSPEWAHKSRGCGRCF